MMGMDCVNQQAYERDCKLTKRSQAERLAIADSLIASVWKEYLNGSIDRSTLQVAAYIQTNVNGIVWKLNELNNPNTPNALKALDCISRQAAIEAINTWDKFGVDERGRLVRWHEGLEPYVHLRDVLTAIVNLPSAQSDRLTDDDFETIRIHLNAQKERLCNQQRWEEADEYQRIIDRFMAFASAQPEYEPVKAEDFAKTMSENTLYSFMAWYGEALELMERQGFVICKKTM